MTMKPENKEDMDKKTDADNAAGKTPCGTGKKKRPYVAPTIEVTYVKHEGNLLAGSRLRPYAEPMVEDREDSGVSNEEIITM